MSGIQRCTSGIASEAFFFAIALALAENLAHEP
jgi:hypothetical protein